MKKADTILYFVTNRGLEIFNWSSDVPQLISRIGTDGISYAVDVDGNYAYVADHYKGLCIIDISLPASPKILGYYGSDCRTYDICVNQGYAYLANFKKGLEIVDVSNPLSPSFVGQCSNIGAAYSITVKDTIAYVGTLFDTTLKIINVADPSKPFVISEYPHAQYPSWGIDAYVEDTIAYVNCHFSSEHDTCNFAIVNVSNPEKPYLLAGLNIPYTNRGMEKRGDYIFTNTQYSGVYIINVADMTAPYIVGKLCDGHMFGYGYAIKDTLLLVPHFISGYSVINVGKPANPVTVYDHKNIEWIYFSFADSLNYLYLVGYTINSHDLSSNSVLKIIDIQNPANLVEHGDFEISGRAFLYENSVDYPYIALTVIPGYPKNESSYTAIIDVSNRNSPEILETINDGGITESHLPYLYTLSGATLKKTIFNDSLVSIDSLRLSSPGYDLTTSDSFAYVTVEDSLLIYNIFTGNKLGSCYHGKPYAKNISLSSSYLAIPYTPYPGSSYGFLLFDISDPNSPSLICDSLITAPAVHPTSINTMGCTLQDTLLFLGRGHYGFDIWNIRYPKSPYRIATQETPLKATHCYPSGNSNIHGINNIIYLLNSGSLEIFKLIDANK